MRTGRCRVRQAEPSLNFGRLRAQLLRPRRRVRRRTARNLHIVKSPIVGTLYEAPSPGAPPFVKVGDMVEVGQVLCIVEAMKLLNEIESDVAGEIVRRWGATASRLSTGRSCSPSGRRSEGD